MKNRVNLSERFALVACRHPNPILIDTHIVNRTFGIQNFKYGTGKIDRHRIFPFHEKRP